MVVLLSASFPDELEAGGGPVVPARSTDLHRRLSISASRQPVARQAAGGGWWRLSTRHHRVTGAAPMLTTAPATQVRASINPK
jgi:hypothetical protein